MDDYIKKVAYVTVREMSGCRLYEKEVTDDDGIVRFFDSLSQWDRRNYYEYILRDAGGASGQKPETYEPALSAVFLEGRSIRAAMLISITDQGELQPDIMLYTGTPRQALAMLREVNERICERYSPDTPVRLYCRMERGEKLMRYLFPGLVWTEKIENGQGG